MSDSVTNQPRSLFQRLSESSHPIALLFFLGFRIGALLSYLFGLLFTSNFVLVFILVVLLLAADFWNVKNVSGRLLVGLRWWNESSPDGKSIWVFETADPQRYINPIDSKVFWLMLYVTPALWCGLALLAILKFEFLWLLLIGIALILTIINALAFSRCDKFGKANSVANNFLGNVSSGIGSRMFSGITSRFFR
ncbi:golgi apparatus membrane protein Tvp23p [Trichomonascus vanleenenianus]|uniref:Tvp23p n=1 Tax=Trichomonascus vanleenenianus TaxID=2268995 RepID=UPI003ECAE72E